LVLRLFGKIKEEEYLEFIGDKKAKKIDKPDIEIKKDIERLIIIDDDVGMFWKGVWDNGHFWVDWLRITDPDGGLELIYALRDPNIKILGVTIMMGVAPMKTCLQAAKNILKILDMENIPIVPGARTPDDLGKETEAVKFIIDMIKKYPNRVEIIATGPLTNIATAMMFEPELPKMWKTLHFATGEFRGALGKISDLFLPSLIGIPDLNINVDVEATKYVIENGGGFPIYPNEIMDELRLTRSDYFKVKSNKTKISDYIAYELKIHNFCFI
jgi:purine nucleosidase